MEQYFKLIDKDKGHYRQSPIGKHRGRSFETPQFVEKSQIYILVKDFPQEAYPKVIKEFERFGDIKEIQSVSQANWMIILYSKQENAKLAMEHFNPFCIDPYIKHIKINVSAMLEEEKNEFLEKINEMRENEYNNHRNSNVYSNVYPGQRFRIPAQQYMILQEPKSNFKKFIEIFLNI